MRSRNRILGLVGVDIESLSPPSSPASVHLAVVSPSFRRSIVRSTLSILSQPPSRRVARTRRPRRTIVTSGRDDARANERKPRARSSRRAFESVDRVPPRTTARACIHSLRVIPFIHPARGARRCRKLSALIRTSGTYCKIYLHKIGHLMHIVREISLTKCFRRGSNPRSSPYEGDALPLGHESVPFFSVGPVVTRSRRRSTTQCACILVQGLLGVRCVVTVMGGV